MAFIAVNAFYALSNNSLEMGVVNGFGDAVTASAPADAGIVGTPVPEPASLLLLGAGLTVIGTMIRRRHPQPSNS